jgi:hypothetical protein
MNNAEFVALLHEVYESETWPKPLHLLRGAEMVDAGKTVADAAKEVRTTSKALSQVVSADDRVSFVLGMGPRDVGPTERQKAIQILGQLLVGRVAEMAFVDIYRAEMESHELELRDHRKSRTTTDFRLHNGQGRPVYRVNIKFHGALFRQAPETVGLQPEDCFALATYKVWGALGKQESEGLPYLFAVVGERSISGESVGKQIPSRFIEGVALFHASEQAPKKRDFEDRAVQRLVEQEVPVLSTTYEAIHKAPWYIISARKADKLLRELLYDRVFALRVRGFARVYRGAELDMHFSLSEDLVPLRDFLHTLKVDGQAKVVTLLERGVY